MNINDLYANKVPLKINDEIIEGAFVKELPLTELVKLQDIVKEDNQVIKLKLMEDIVKISIVDKENNLIFEKADLSNKYILDCANLVIEVNTPQGK